MSKEMSNNIRFPLWPLVLFFCGLIFLGALAYGHYLVEARASKSWLVTQELDNLNLGKSLFHQELNQVYPDAEFLASLQDLPKIVKGNLTELEDTKSIFVYFSLIKRNYSRIRFVNNQGQEVIHVDYNNGAPRIVPDSNLQNISGSDYFKKAAHLNLKEIYISAFRMDADPLGTAPLKSVIYFAVPVFEQGQRQGFIILDYSANILREKLKEACAGAARSLMLINPEGYWLLAPRSEDEWGFARADREQRRFGTDFPWEWEKIKSSDAGQLITAAGLFTYASIYPLKPYGEKTEGVFDKNKSSSGMMLPLASEYWKVISFVPAAHLEQILRAIALRVIRTYSLIFVFWVFLSTLFLLIFRKIRRGEEKVAQTQRMYKLLLEGAADAIIILDNQGHIITINQAVSRISGYSSEELVGQHFLTISALTEESRQKVMEEYPRILNGESRPPMNLIICNKSGKKMFFEANVNRVEKSTGEFCVQAILRDVTQRRESEETIKQTQLNYLTVFNSVNDAILVYEFKAGKVLDVNQRLCELLGYSREEAITMSLADFSSGEAPYDQVNAMRMLERAAQGELLPLFEWKARHKDGHLLWVEVGLKIANIDGRDCALGIVRNINDRKLAEDALRKEKERAQNYLNIAETMILAINRDGRISLINKRGCEILGYSENELLGQDWFMMCLPEAARSGVKLVFTQLISGEGDYFKNSESLISTKDGKERLIAWHNTVIRDEQDNIIGSLSSGEDITEQRNMEEALRQQYYFLQKLIDTIPTPIFYKNVRGEYLGCNVAFQNFIGRFKEDIIGKTLYDMASKELADENYNMDRSLLCQGGIQIYENDVQRPDGITRKVVFNKALYYNVDGTIAGIVGIIQDITERKTVEENLKRIQVQQKAILDNIPDMAWLKDKESRFIAVNKPFEKLCGLSSEDLLGKTDLDVWPKDLAEHYRADDLEVMQSGRRKVVEEEIVGKDGRSHWTETIKTPIYGEDGNVIGTAGIARDITARRHLEQDLIKLSHAVDQSPASIVITDIDANIEYVNAKFTEVTGYTFQESLGKNPRILKSGQQPPGVYKQMWQAITSGKEWRGEFLNKKKNGGLYWESVLMSPIKDSDGKIIRYLAVKEEITERKKMEQAIAQMHRDLAQEDIKLRQALSDLEKKNRELKETQERSLQIEKMAAIGQLSAGIAHEIKNPLAIILLCVDELENAYASKDGVIKKNITKIKNASERADKVITDLLNFAHQSRMTLGMVDVHEVIESAANFIGHLTKAKGIAISKNFVKEKVKLSGDKILLEQVVVNILTNAIDAIGENGEVFITTSVQGEKGEQSFVVVEIRDTGCGIPPDVLSHIFEPFFTTKEVGRGTGLGLSTVYKILERHKGTIDIKSKPQEGTTVTFKIPLPYA